MIMTDMDLWVRDQYRALYCDEDGKQCAPYLRAPFTAILKTARPNNAKAIKSAVGQ